MSEWISVDDRLPEYTAHAGSKQFVLVIANSQLGIHEVMYVNRKWLFSTGIEVKVTHWMPLPEPPE